MSLTVEERKERKNAKTMPDPTVETTHVPMSFLKVQGLKLHLDRCLL